jgi:hypothetical protein
MNGVQAAGFLPERHFEAPFVELVDGVRTVWGLQPKERAIW